MAKVLTAISLDSPASPQSLSVNDTFQFAGTPTLSGGGGVQRYDFKWQVDSGGGFVTIAASGTGLITSGTNPIVNTNSQAQQAITVTCDQAGEYTVRMVGAPTSGGSYTVLSATQTVSVSAGPEEHFGTLSVSGGGSVAAQGRKGASSALSVAGGGAVGAQVATTRFSSLAVNGGGSVSVVQTTGRSSALQASGGGGLTIAYTVGGGPEEHFGTLSVSGGGSATLSGRKGAQYALQVSGGGSVALIQTTDRLGSLLVSGGGSFAVSYTTFVAPQPQPPFVLTIEDRPYGAKVKNTVYTTDIENKAFTL